MIDSEIFSRQRVASELPRFHHQEPAQSPKHLELLQDWLSLLIQPGPRSWPKIFTQPKTSFSPTETVSSVQIFSFLQKQLAALSSSTAQQEFLVHFLSSIALEAHQGNISLLYQLNSTHHQLTLTDPLYGTEADLQTVCLQAVNQAQTAAGRQRYQLELAQLQQLTQLINQELDHFSTFFCQPLAWLTELGRLAETDLAEIFSTTNWMETSALLSPSLTAKYHLSWPAKIYAGPKYFYLMPPSSVHPGQLTMAIIAQPIYSPETNQWLVAQWQVLVKKNWTELTNLLNRLQSPQPWPTDLAQLENALLAQIISLPQAWQTLPGELILDRLLCQPEIQLDQLISSPALTRLDQSLDLRLTSPNPDQNLSPSQSLPINGSDTPLLDHLQIQHYAQLLAAVCQLPSSQISIKTAILENIILSGLAHREPLTEKQLAAFLNQFISNSPAKNPISSLKNLAHLHPAVQINAQIKSLLNFATQAGFASAGMPVNFSAIECLTIGTLQAPTKLLPNSSSSASQLLSANTRRSHSSEICLTCPNCGHHPIYGSTCPKCGFKRGQKIDKSAQLFHSFLDYSQIEADQPDQSLDANLAQPNNNSGNSGATISLGDFIASLL